LANETLIEIFDNEENAQKTSSVIASFVDSYSRQKNTLALDVWLNQEFAKYPEIWADENERQQATLEIIETVQKNNDEKVDLYAHLDKGKSRESWLAKKIEQGATAAGVVSVGQYAEQVDNVLKDANQSTWDTLTRKDGLISQNVNLDGFIAEYHHASSFNIDAVAKGSPYRARVLEPKLGDSYAKNSVDIGIYDAEGKLVRRYQAKYGADNKATDKLFEKGDCRGQRKLVPKGQADANSSEVIEIDGISSKPLSKEEAKALQKQAQQEQEIKQYDWNDANRMTIAKEIGKKALVSAAFCAGFQGSRILGRRV